MKKERKHEKVFYERWARDKYVDRIVYTREGHTFGESDVPLLFDKRPWKEQETSKTDYLYREDDEGLHIALFYGGFPGYEQRWLEFHDSTLIATHEAAEVIRVELDGYIHQWEGAGTSRRGTGWSQRVTLEIEVPIVEARVTTMPCDISDGRVQSELLPPKMDGMLPIPIVLDGHCSLEILSVNAETMRITGRRLRATPSGLPQFVEPLPEDMDPQRGDG